MSSVLMLTFSYLVSTYNRNFTNYIDVIMHTLLFLHIWRYTVCLHTTHYILAHRHAITQMLHKLTVYRIQNGRSKV